MTKLTQDTIKLNEISWFGSSRVCDTRPVKNIYKPETSKPDVLKFLITPPEPVRNPLHKIFVELYLSKLTRIDLQTEETAWHAGEFGKSMGKILRHRILSNGSSPC